MSLRAYLTLVAFLALAWCVKDAAPRDDGLAELRKFAPTADVLERDGYLIGRPDQTGNPRWVLYEFKDHDGPGKRRDNWHADADALPERHGRASDYEGSGLSKGHLKPADDAHHSQHEMDATFTYANSVLQYQLVNAQSYEHVEQRGRDLKATGARVWALVFPVWKPAFTTEVSEKGKVHERQRLIIDAVGRDQLWIPHYLCRSYRIEDKNGVRFETYLVGNTDLVAKEEIDTFRVSIDDVEFAAGMDLWGTDYEELEKQK